MLKEKSGPNLKVTNVSYGWKRGSLIRLEATSHIEGEEDNFNKIRHQANQQIQALNDIANRS